MTAEDTGKIIVAGQTALDISPAFREYNLQRLADIFLPGKVVKTGKLTVHLGGTVFNTGLALKKFGASVKLIGKIGDDVIGMLTKELLKPFSEEDSMITASGEDSAYTIVFALKGFDRFFMNYYGCNDNFSSADINETNLEGASHFHFGYPPLMKRMYRNEGEELEKIFRMVKGQHIRTSLDMAAVDENSEAAKCNWKRILEKVLPYVDFFVPSIEEICSFLHPERYAEWIKRAQGRNVTQFLSVAQDVIPLAKELLEMGTKAVMIKCGASGLYFRSGTKSCLKKLGNSFDGWGEKSIFMRGFQAEKVVSGTGAGDTCIAAFLKKMADGEELEECLRMAAAAGACCVASYDAIGGLRTMEEMERKINNGWIQNELSSDEQLLLQKAGVTIL